MEFDGRLTTDHSIQDDCRESISIVDVPRMQMSPTEQANPKELAMLSVR